MLRLFSPMRMGMRLPFQLDELLRLGSAFPTWDRDLVAAEKLHHPVVRQEDGSYKMHLFLDARHFKPEEVSIETKEGQITVSASAERRSEDGNYYTSSSFRRSLPVPEGVDKAAIEAKFVDGGILLEAPAQPPKEPQPVDGDTPLPIKHE